jgi:hypothetical protein
MCSYSLCSFDPTPRKCFRPGIDALLSFAQSRYEFASLKIGSGYSDVGDLEVIPIIMLARRLRWARLIPRQGHRNQQEHAEPP